MFNAGLVEYQISLSRAYIRRLGVIIVSGFFSVFPLFVDSFYSASDKQCYHFA